LILVSKNFATIENYVLYQGCPNSVLEGWHPAEFSANLPQQTHQEVSSMTIVTLISWFRCV